MKCWYQIVLVGIVLVASLAPAQTSNSRYDPVPNRGDKQGSNFIDFQLKRLNPQDIDYGQRIEAMRRGAIEATIDDYYYWSNLATITALLITFCMYFRLNAVHKRRAFSTARVVAWCHNALVEARGEALQQGAKYLELKRITDDQVEARSSQEQQATSDKETITGLRQQVTVLTHRLLEEQQKNRNLKGG